MRSNPFIPAWSLFLASGLAAGGNENQWVSNENQRFPNENQGFLMKIICFPIRAFGGISPRAGSFGNTVRSVGPSSVAAFGLSVRSRLRVRSGTRCGPYFLLRSLRSVCRFVPACGVVRARGSVRHSFFCRLVLIQRLRQTSISISISISLYIYIYIYRERERYCIRHVYGDPRYRILADHAAIHIHAHGQPVTHLRSHLGSRKALPSSQSTSNRDRRMSGPLPREKLPRDIRVPGALTTQVIEACILSVELRNLRGMWHKVKARTRPKSRERASRARRVRPKAPALAPSWRSTFAGAVPLEMSCFSRCGRRRLASD